MKENLIICPLSEGIMGHFPTMWERQTMIQGQQKVHSQVHKYIIKSQHMQNTSAQTFGCYCTL